MGLYYIEHTFAIPDVSFFSYVTALRVGILDRSASYNLISNIEGIACDLLLGNYFLIFNLRFF